MKINDVKENNKELKSVILSVRTFPSYSEWLKENKISPSKVFNKAVEELMENKK